MLLSRRLGSGAALLVWVASCCVGCHRERPSKVQEPPRQTFPPVQKTQKVLGPPSVPACFVPRPTFDTTLGRISAGTAFAVTIPGQSRPLILTAIHLLGPMGGLPRDVPAKEVPRVMKGLTLKDCFDASISIGNAGNPIMIPDAAPFDKPSKAGDILAFWGPEDASLQPSRLAAATPAKGERVWLAASLREGAPPTQRLHPATIIEIDQNGDLVYRFDNPKVSIRATSGAPVLNAASEVVAINWGGGSDEKGMLGCGNPVERFAPQLEAAVKQSAVRPEESRVWSNNSMASLVNRQNLPAEGLLTLPGRYNRNVQPHARLLRRDFLSLCVSHQAAPNNSSGSKPPGRLPRPGDCGPFALRQETAACPMPTIQKRRGRAVASGLSSVSVRHEGSLVA